MMPRVIGDEHPTLGHMRNTLTNAKSALFYGHLLSQQCGWWLSMPERRAEVAPNAVRDARVQARSADQQHEDGQQAAGGDEHAELRRRVCKIPRGGPPHRVWPLALRDGLSLAVAIMPMQARVRCSQTCQRPAVCKQPGLGCSGMDGVILISGGWGGGRGL